MVARLDPCNPDALRLLLADRLPPARVGAIESHLEFCPHCRRELDELAGGGRWSSAVRVYLAGEPEPEAEKDDPTDALEFLSDSDDPTSLGKIGPYEVKGVLGRGGNGVVLKAFDAGLNRFVAVKVIANVLAGSGAARKRFIREAHAAAAVVHEHVIAVHHTDEANGLPYLVMEYVNGKSLQDRLDREGPLELKEALRIGMQTAYGLAAAHAQGLVHRDIKPANILLENGVERVKITDFGLARAVADASLTQSGVITGTPHYMAPEQARGDAVDHRADLFSLGSTLYATCTGHPPFRADTPLAVLRRVTDEVPRPVRQINTDVPAWFEAIVAKLLAKNPAERYQTAAEVAELLEKCLAHVQQPLSAPLPAVPGHPLGARRRRWLEATAGAAMVLVATAVVMTPRGPTQMTDLGVHQEKREEAVDTTVVAQVSTNPTEGALKADLIDDGIQKSKQWAMDIDYRLRFPEHRLIDPVGEGIFEVAVRTAALEQDLKDVARCEDDECPEQKKARSSKRTKTSP